MPVFGRVDVTAEAVVICGSGPSLRAFDRGAATVIAVNGAIECPGLPADHWFTLDPSPANRARMALQVPGVRYWAAVPDDYGTSTARISTLRPPAEPGVTYLRRVLGSGFQHGRDGLSTDPATVHTGNSAYGALGLAFHMGVRRVLLMGLDGTGGYAIGTGNPGDLRHLPALFESALPQLAAAGVQVVNACPHSTITAFPRTTFSEGITWIQQPQPKP